MQKGSESSKATSRSRSHSSSSASSRSSVSSFCSSDDDDVFDKDHQPAATPNECPFAVTAQERTTATKLKDFIEKTLEKRMLTGQAEQFYEYSQPNQYYHLKEPITGGKKDKNKAFFKGFVQKFPNLFYVRSNGKQGRRAKAKNYTVSLVPNGAWARECQVANQLVEVPITN